MTDRAVGCGAGVGAWMAGMVLMGLTACRTSPPPQPAEPRPVVPAPVWREAAPIAARRLQVVPDESRLLILVYRGGAMARLGHNHVIASRHLEGEILATAEVAQTRFDIRVPVNELTVDEPALREAAGPDFPPGVPQSAREGTRQNLLSEALLDGARYPVIRLQATEVQGAGEYADVTVEITFKDRPLSVRVPVTLEHVPEGLRARGEFRLRQSALGLKPFSVAMGTLVVLDEMTIRFDVLAR